MDLTVQMPSYPEIAYNNTYDVSFISEDIYEGIKLNYTKPGGCLDQITQCRTLASQLDPDDLGTDEEVNTLCATAFSYCYNYVEYVPIELSGVSFSPISSIFHQIYSITLVRLIVVDVNGEQRSTFDLAHLLANPWPPAYPAGFFNQAWVQKDLAVPLNFTLDSNIVETAFFSTGDPIRQNISAMEYILKSGLKAALVYGDRDYVCNCMLPTWLRVTLKSRITI